MSQKANKPTGKPYGEWQIGDLVRCVEDEPVFDLYLGEIYRIRAFADGWHRGLGANDLLYIEQRGQRCKTNNISFFLERFVHVQILLPCAICLEQMEPETDDYLCLDCANE